MELSVVIPVYGCEGALRTLHERLTVTLQGMGADYEIVFVDDRSDDGAWQTLTALAAEDRAVRAFRLSRNFGQQAAITAGLAQSRGRWTVVMDCDLQDPPEVIPRLHSKACEGYDVVYGVRRRAGTPRARRLATWVYARAMNAAAGTRIDPGHGCLCVMSRRVVEAYLDIPDRDRNHMLILYWLGFESASVEFEQAPRHSGRSSYSARGLVRLALDGLFFQSAVLLRWIVYLGFALAAAGAALAAYYVIARISGSVPAGFTSLAVLLLTLSGFVIISTGVTGLYIGRVFEQVKGRPLYVIEQATEERDAAGRVTGAEQVEARARR